MAIFKNSIWTYQVANTNVASEGRIDFSLSLYQKLNTSQLLVLQFYPLSVDYLENIVAYHLVPKLVDMKLCKSS